MHPGPNTFFAFAALLAGSVAGASDPPDSAVNPQSGFVETVDATWNQTDYDVRHVVDSGPPAKVTLLASGSEDDRGPRIALAPNGDTFVVWWRDRVVDGILVMRRDHATDTWGTERLASDGDEDSRHPEIVHDGQTAWAAWEIDSGGGTDVAVSALPTEPSPFPGRTVLASTSYGGDVDVLIEADGGSLWVTWVDSGTQVGWSAYDAATGTWTTADYESYAEDDVPSARARIRSAVSGN